MPVATVFENLEAGSSIEEIVEQFHVTREQIQAVLEFAARSLDPPPPSRGRRGPKGCASFLITARPAALQRRLQSTRLQRRESKVGIEFPTALALAESAGFDVLLTTDKSIRYQQNLVED
jgi:hypothetical protein